MKNRTLKTILCAGIMALALSATACGSDDAAKTEESAGVENAEDADAEKEAEPEAPAQDETKDEAKAETETDTADNGGTEGYSTLEEYYNDPSVKSALDAAFGSLAQEGMSLSIDVKGNVFTMVCKFEDSSVIVDGISDLLEQGLDANEATFQSQVAAFDETIGQSGACTVVVRYTDPDDNVLVEREYKAE